MAVWCAAEMFVVPCALSASERCQQPSLHTGFVTVFSLELRSVGRGFKSYSRQRCKLFTPVCLCQSKQYNLVPAKGRWCCAAGEVTAGRAESNGSLPPGGWLTVTYRLTACTPGSAPGPTLGIEFVKSFFSLTQSTVLHSPHRRNCQTCHSKLSYFDSLFTLTFAQTLAAFYIRNQTTVVVDLLSTAGIRLVHCDVM